MIIIDYINCIYIYIYTEYIQIYIYNIHSCIYTEPQSRIYVSRVILNLNLYFTVVIQQQLGIAPQFLLGSKTSSTRPEVRGSGSRAVTPRGRVTGVHSEAGGTALEGPIFFQDAKTRISS